jgi:mannose-6-phosphate isomerase-like protein (cupin superfamily)
MIIRQASMRNEVKEHMRDGEGNIALRHLLSPEQVPGGRLFSELTLVPGSSIGEHTHTGETEYYYILEGTGEVDEGTGPIAIAAGDLVVTGNGESHSIRNNGDTPLRLIALILFDQENLSSQ